MSYTVQCLKLTMKSVMNIKHTQEEQIIVRAANVNDLVVATPLMYSAGPEAFEFMFTRYGRQAKDFVDYCYEDGRGLQGYKNHRLAVRESDGLVLGAGAFYSGVEYGHLSKQTVSQIRHFYGALNLLKMLPDLLAMGQWMKAPKNHTDYVANLGVVPEARGQGVGTILLQDGLVRARERGKLYYALDVAKTNPNAERLYRRFGLKEQWNNEFSRSDMIPGAIRLQMKVST